MRLAALPVQLRRRAVPAPSRLLGCVVTRFDSARLHCAFAGDWQLYIYRGTWVRRYYSILIIHIILQFYYIASLDISSTTHHDHNSSTSNQR
jgi:hypothetical protein